MGARFVAPPRNIRTYPGLRSYLVKVDRLFKLESSQRSLVVEFRNDFGSAELVLRIMALPAHQISRGSDFPKPLFSESRQHNRDKNDFNLHHRIAE